MPVVNITRTMDNASFFLRHAQPGMLGLLAARGRVVPDLLRTLTGRPWMGGSGFPSYWSHSFLVVDRTTVQGRDQIVIVESTRLPKRDREGWARALPGHPEWDGPQWSVLVASDGDDALEGQPARKDLRRYINDTWTPNVALVDVGVQDTEALQRAALGSLDPAVRYATWELLGTFLSCLAGKLDHPNLFDSDDIFNTAYVRLLLERHVPAIAALEQDESNTHCEHLYRLARRQDWPVVQIIRSLEPGRGWGPASPPLPPDVSAQDALRVIEDAWRQAGLTNRQRKSKLRRVFEAKTAPAAHQKILERPWQAHQERPV